MFEAVVGIRHVCNTGDRLTCAIVTNTHQYFVSEGIYISCLMGLPFTLFNPLKGTDPKFVDPFKVVILR